MNSIGENAIYLELKNISGNSSFVEMFFIMAGFFLYNTYKNKPDLTLGEFAVNKIIRLWPVMVFEVIVIALFISSFKTSNIFDILFLKCVGISSQYKGITWYISPLFWITIFYFSLLKNFNNKKLNIVIVVMVYFSYVININHGYSRETIYYGLNLAVLRAISGIGLGYLVGQAFNKYGFILTQKTNKIHKKIAKTIFFSFIEGSALAFIIYFSLFCNKHYNKFIFVIAFIVLLICFLVKQGVISKLMDNNISTFLGRFSYSTYVMQQFSFNIMKRSIWRKSYIIDNVYICIIISVLFSLLIGILVYFFVEKPLKILLSKIYLKLKQKYSNNKSHNVA